MEEELKLKTKGNAEESSEDVTLFLPLYKNTTGSPLTSRSSTEEVAAQPTAAELPEFLPTLPQPQSIPAISPSQSSGLQIRPVTSFLRAHEIELLGRPERHLKLQGLTFRIVENGFFRGSLYRALAQAVTNEEMDFSVIRQIVAKRIIDQWDTFGRVLVPAYRSKIKGFTPEEIGDKSTVKRAYLNASLQGEIEGTLVELGVAAERYGFTYSVILIEDMAKKTLRVINCHDEQVKAKATTKYFFIRSGSSFEEWHWEYMIPMEKVPMKINLTPGSYPVRLGSAYLYNGKALTFTKSGKVPSTMENLFKAFCLADGRLYGFVTMPIPLPPNLFANLSMFLYGSPNLSYEIHETIKGHRKKNSSTSASHADLEPGTIHDVKVAAKVFLFTFSIYSLDEYGNFLKLEETPLGFLSLSNGETMDTDALRHLTLLTRTRRHLPIEWAMLRPAPMRVLESDNSSVLSPSAALSKDLNLRNSQNRVDYTIYYLDPLHPPYTEKKRGLFGIRYRTLKKESKQELKDLIQNISPVESHQETAEEVDDDETSSANADDSIAEESGERANEEETYFADLSNSSRTSNEHSECARVVENPDREDTPPKSGTSAVVGVTSPAETAYPSPPSKAPSKGTFASLFQSGMEAVGLYSRNRKVAAEDMPKSTKAEATEPAGSRSTKKMYVFKQESARK